MRLKRVSRPNRLIIALIHLLDFLIYLFNEYRNDLNHKQCDQRLDLPLVINADGTRNRLNNVIRFNCIFIKNDRKCVYLMNR